MVNLLCYFTNYLFSINYFLFKMNISNNVTFEIVINNTNSFDNFNKSTKMYTVVLDR